MLLTRPLPDAPSLLGEVVAKSLYLVSRTETGSNPPPNVVETGSTGRSCVDVLELRDNARTSGVDWVLACGTYAKGSGIEKNQY